MAIGDIRRAQERAEARSRALASGVQPLLDAWTSLKTAQKQLEDFAATLDMPKQRLFRAQVRNAALETGKIVLLVEEALHE